MIEEIDHVAYGWNRIDVAGSPGGSAESSLVPCDHSIALGEKRHLLIPGHMGSAESVSQDHDVTRVAPELEAGSLSV
jgi:hypothetical protein